MAEALSVIYRGFAVVSLALQLLDTAQKLREFWHSFEDAGSEVERIKEHLVTLHAVAATVAEIGKQETQIKCTEVVLSSLLAWRTRTERLTHFDEEYRKGQTSRTVGQRLDKFSINSQGQNHSQN